MNTPEDMAAIRAQLEQMSPEERKQLALKICEAANEMSKTIVDNADAIWQSREHLK